ncbi:MAG: hypothetical protein A2096_11270 [Spirochaetes bacterium GWF1_41_5]|nr:MAG: hypothetical protein A2096_11270 [Spirochaetes bacterium GWF1_41_5]HBE02445.1 hypothetical protein [Spirochaetia bacterium]
MNTQKNFTGVLILMLALLSFIHLLGIEKAVLAIIFGILALKYDSENKKIIRVAIIISLIYLVIIAIILIFKIPELNSFLEKL